MEIKRPPSKQHMPPEAKLVFKGVIFDVYQWEQELFDGAKTTFERLKRADTALVIPVTPEGEIILAAQEQPGKTPFLGLVGGRLEPDEDPLGAARRELLEETGYEAGEMVLWHALQPVSKLDWVIYTFIAKDCHKVSEQKLDGGEKIELKFLDFDEFVRVSTEDGFFVETETLTELLRAKNDLDKMADLKKLFGIS